MSDDRIGCVVVTYNRLNKLKKALRAYEEQLEHPEYIVVVDNASTDGTNEFLNEWKTEKSIEKRYVISLKENAGGSGGFYAGQKMAMGLSADWIMLSDDDAYPESDYIKGIKDYIVHHDCSNIAVLCGSVYENNSYINLHRAVYLKHFIDNGFIKPAIKEELKKINDLYSIEFASYVGSVVKKNSMDKAGLCNPKFFIWADDFEHMYRLEKTGIVGYLPQFKIIHDTENVKGGLSWKTYYGIRNRLYFLKKYCYMYYILTVSISVLKAFLCPLKGKKIIEIKLRLTAIKDASKEKLGIHNIYKPGWKI